MSRAPRPDDQPAGAGAAGQGAADDEVDRLALEVVRRAVRRGTTLGTGESLTAGSVCAALGGVPGVSAVLRGAVVAYSPQVKRSLLGVDAEVLERHGAVSEPVVRQMVAGARRVLGVDLAVATTGVAGPGPADGVEAGTVYVCVQDGDDPPAVRRLELPGDRRQVRAATTATALAMLLERLRSA